VLCESNAGGLSTKSLINHLKSKHRIHVILESEDHKTIPELEEIRSQIVKKEMSLFEARKKRSKNIKKLFHALITIKPKPLERERDFSPTGQFVTKLRNRLNDECVLWLSCVSITNNHWKTVANLINNSLINCGGTNSSNFTVILSFGVK